MADSPVGGGQICGLGEGVGISQHPYFSVVSRCAAPKRAATKLRVQLALDPLFSVLLWDSGFVAIDATGPDQRTPYIAYTGAPLPLGAPIYVRAGVKDDQDAASPFSTVLPNGATPQFSVATPAGACDLRVGTDISSEKQGNPAVLPSHKLRFTAEYVGAELQANQAQVEISMASDFGEVFWNSGWVNIAAISTGQRCQPILTEGDFDASTAYFWRIRFKDTTAAISSWNAAGASFVVQYPDPTQPAPAGFGGAKRDVGIFGMQSSDVAVSDINSDGVPDIVIANETAGEPHTIQLSFGAANPGAALHFGAAIGGAARVACFDCDLDGDCDIAVLSGHSLTVYANAGMTFTPLSPLIIPGSGELIELHAADLDWSGWPSLVASYQDSVYWLPNTEGSFSTPVEVNTSPSSLLDVCVADFLDDARPEIVLLRDGQLLVFGIVKGFVNDLGVWPFAGAAQFAGSSLNHMDLVGVSWRVKGSRSLPSGAPIR
ncbi:MAG: VCBS repeat-containing protein [Planctomycetes bacterium]|nr:VCBS repeat-containing protein [Planctomycetota bacterium]